ncbi:MAG: hypothetical protein AAB316_22475, partial [Bacteroidota bacterium]
KEPQDTVPKDAALEREGPANLPFEILSQVQSDYEFESYRGILNIFRKVYRDANAKSGYYYFLPAEYNLNWSPDNGQYAFYVSFKSAGESGRGEAVVTAELKPNITRSDLELARRLLELDVAKDPVAKKYGVKQLISMPLAAPPQISFDQVRNYGVKPEDIIVRTPTDFLDPIVLSWKMDRVDDLLSALFNNVGLNGNLTIRPEGKDMPDIVIPISLKIDDPKTFGKFEVEASAWRNGGWQNKTDYPLALKNFHVMKLEMVGNERRPKIYTWKMGDAEVPEKASVKFDAALVPAWLDSHPDVEKIWLEYLVKPCQSCNATVREKILGGVSSNQVNGIEITTLTPLAFTGGKMIKVKIRSAQADPNKLRKLQLPTLTVTQDYQTLAGGQLFLDEGESPDFEYSLQIIMEDGSKYESDGWLKCRDLEVVIGEKQIREMVPFFSSK